MKYTYIDNHNIDGLAQVCDGVIVKLSISGAPRKSFQYITLFKRQLFHVFFCNKMLI